MKAGRVREFAGPLGTSREMESHVGEASHAQLDLATGSEFCVRLLRVIPECRQK
jgi:hypothetical protein